MSTVTKTNDSDIIAHPQSPILKEYNLKLSHRSVSCSNTVQILPEDANWNSACFSNSSQSSHSILNNQLSCENFRNVEYDICPILPSQNGNNQQSDITFKLQLSNLFMYVNEQTFENSLHISKASSHHSSFLIDEQPKFKLEEEENEKTIRETNNDLFLSQPGLKCTQVRKYQKNDIIQISFVQDAQLQANKQIFELQMQESFAQPQKDQQMNHYQKLSDSMNKINQPSENQFESSHLLQSSSKNYIQTKNFDDQQSSNQFTKRFGIKFENLFPHQEISSLKQKNFSNPQINLKNISEIESWVKLRIVNQVDLQNYNKKQIRRGGSNYYIFTFDQKLQRYFLARQVLDQQFVDLIHSNFDEITYSYLHSESITSGISPKIKQYMQIAVDKILDMSQKKCTGQTYEILQSQFNEQVQTFQLNEFLPVSQNERSIFMNENMHFFNPLFMANIYCEKSNEIIKKQIIPYHIVLEQSYFISTEPKQNGDHKKTNKSSSIIKLYSNSIKKNVSYRQYINHQYLEQSIAFQEKFYQIKTIWKRRGKNQKRKSKYHSDEEFSSFDTN
ncbi:hypothetical protein TTHERM_00242610 (macronuclear) [Tetrahymena thermophila SB210]|uniref:SRCR domain-containing protein n=1 Tax=Tetrahymena thermophila (strain SB210) TaxID=312017 RepID=I7LXJ1_TETTS|nr:hypothetical protein TTHERM_00242610 [Tetrahymena thermophila SB210]EAS04739.1 hypothetical protein TTHERM_00242610 [Tetrahymena thermophila SB210]|eukprot:XP_001024984.1 hypothetical protein TTHERM_00242610 [Tetrahymena thermophila SB210]